MTDPKTTPTTPTDSAVAELINKARAAAPATASPTGKSRAEALQEAMEQNENDQHERVAAINFLDTEEATRHQQYLTARQTFLDEMDALAADHDKLVAELHRLKQGLTPRGAPASKPAADNPSLIDRLKGAGASGSDDPSSKDPKDSKKPGFGQRFVMGLTK